MRALSALRELRAHLNYFGPPEPPGGLVGLPERLWEPPEYENAATTPLNHNASKKGGRRHGGGALKI